MGSSTNRALCSPSTRPATGRKIYVASSWRNTIQPLIVGLLRDAGHEVYDFRQPAPDNTGFAWSEIDPDWQNWTPDQFIADLYSGHPAIVRGFGFDKAALDWCDTCVLVLPSGRSAHLEAGYCAGQGKLVLAYLHPDRFEPELMYLLGNGCVTTPEQLLKRLEVEAPARNVSVDAIQFAHLLSENDRLRGRVDALLAANNATEEKRREAARRLATVRSTTQTLQEALHNRNETISALRKEFLPSLQLKRFHTLRPAAEYQDDFGSVLWWRLPIDSPPEVGTGECGVDIGGLYTHWSLLPSCDDLRSSDRMAVHA